MKIHMYVYNIIFNLLYNDANLMVRKQTIFLDFSFFFFFFEYLEFLFS